MLPCKKSMIYNEGMDVNENMDRFMAHKQYMKGKKRTLRRLL